MGELDDVARPLAPWLLLHAKDLPPAVRAAWRVRVERAIQEHSEGWRVAVTLAGEDFEARAEKDATGRPAWRAWSESVSGRYCGLVVPVEPGEAGAFVGRATSDILQAAAGMADPPHRIAWSVAAGTFHAILRLEPHWVGDERPWRAWSRLVLEAPPARKGLGRAPVEAAPGGNDAAEFVALCDEVIDYAESVLGEKRNDAAVGFLDSVSEKLESMRDFAADRGFVTDRMQSAVENIRSGIEKWDR